jgi:hypothetical protein
MAKASKMQKVIMKLYYLRELLTGTENAAANTIVELPGHFMIGRKLQYYNIVNAIRRASAEHAAVFPENVKDLLRFLPNYVGPGAAPLLLPPGDQYAGRPRGHSRMAYQMTVQGVCKAEWNCHLLSMARFPSTEHALSFLGLARPVHRADFGWSPSIIIVAVGCACGPLWLGQEPQLASAR